ncbi:hypothetical protein SCHPADRAFT_925113 [Schizopora paradoxa]|uniref:Uncharacterized protein n=1 Tax=Schizopora paradoxa TaxID=27342 RepID=A0A0H2S2D9_9AGAM|nr:hypothetical protein SCHPADRAFT_925113 [Schizopora paradoxa]
MHSAIRLSCVVQSDAPYDVSTEPSLFQSVGDDTTNTQPTLWVKVLELHHLLRSSRISDNEKVWIESEYISVSKPWKDLCCEILSFSEDARLCERLKSLDDVHGPGMRERFPPRNESMIDREERACRKRATTKIHICNSKTWRRDL